MTPAFPRARPLLVIGAVPHETRLVEAALGAVEVPDTPWRMLGAPDGTRVVSCGVGPANAAGALAWALARSPSGHVVNVGSAGTFDAARLPLKGVCVVTEEDFVDMGTRLADGGWRPAHELKLYLDAGTDNAIPLSPPEELPGDLPFPVVSAPGATVHHVCGTPEDAAERHALRGALVESMEGAALALVCRRLGVPFTQLRGVSNLAGGPREGWETKAAGRNAQHLLLRLLGRDVPGGA
jgi:futalosine hydrolase